jgi:hypothetical protein
LVPCELHTIRSRKLTNSLRIPRVGTALGLVVLASSVLLDLVAPSELVLDLTALDTLELLQELDASGTGLIAAVLELELVAARAHGDALDGDEGGGGAGGHDLVEGRDFLVFDLKNMMVSLKGEIRY